LDTFAPVARVIRFAPRIADIPVTFFVERTFFSAIDAFGRFYDRPAKHGRYQQHHPQTALQGKRTHVGLLRNWNP
jgi:hypothetical protein